MDDCPQQALPAQAIDAHPIDTPRSIIGYRLVNRKGRQTEQVLIDWIDRPESERTWEDLAWIIHLNPTANLEDKVRAAGYGDVTIPIDAVAAAAQLKKDWKMEPEEAEGSTEQPTVEPNRTLAGRSQRTRHSTQRAEFSYD